MLACNEIMKKFKMVLDIMLPGYSLYVFRKKITNVNVFTFGL